jgi:hypothetical protein
MTTYLAHSPAMRSRSLPASSNDQRKHGLAALIAGTTLTGAVLGMAAAAPSSGSAHAAASSNTASTIESQVGTVTAVNPTSITVKSADGLSKTYLVGEGTAVDCKHNGIATVEVGDPVAVTASVAAGKANATDIADVGASAPPLSRILLQASPLAPPFQSCLSHSGAFSVP